MATNDPDFYQAPKFTPEPDEYRPRQRGCFFYGCVIASVLTVLLIIALALVAYLFYRGFNRYLEEYTETAPRELPKVQISEEERTTVVERFQKFRQAIKDGAPAEPLVLTGDDLNALVEQVPELKGRVYFAIEGDKIKGQVSIPLTLFLDTSMTRGRYVNGGAEFKASLADGVLVVVVDSIEVKGKHPPEEMMTNLRQQNLAKDFYKDPDNAEMIRRFEKLEIKDGKIFITPRVQGQPKPGENSQDKPAEVEKDKPAEAEKAKSAEAQKAKPAEKTSPDSKQEAPKAEAPAPGSPRPGSESEAKKPSAAAA